MHYAEYYKAERSSIVSQTTCFIVRDKSHLVKAVHSSSEIIVKWQNAVWIMNDTMIISDVWRGTCVLTHHHCPAVRRRASSSSSAVKLKIAGWAWWDQPLTEPLTRLHSVWLISGGISWGFIYEHSLLTLKEWRISINFLNRVIVNNLSNPFSRENADILRGGDFVWIRSKTYEF